MVSILYIITLIALCSATMIAPSLPRNEIFKSQCPVEPNILSKGLLYPDRINLSIPSKDFYTHVIHERDPIKLNVTSPKGYPFGVIVYTTGGKKLTYAGTNVVHTGSVSYFEIYNFVDTKNKIVVSLSEISDDISFFEAVMAVLSLTAIIFVIYETKSNVLKGILLLLSLGEIYNAWQTGSLNGLTTRIRVNLLKIK